MIESQYLKDNIKNIQKLLTIPTLKKFEMKSLANLLRLSKIRQYEDNECIIKEGSRDIWLYFLLSGRVRVEKDGVVIAHITKKGDLFGEMRILDTMSRSASVFAEGHTVCLAVDVSATDRFVSEDQNRSDLLFLLFLYRMFAEYTSIRLRLSNEELVKAKKEIECLRKQKK